jgi:hypothetical protein
MQQQEKRERERAWRMNSGGVDVEGKGERGGGRGWEE